MGYSSRAWWSRQRCAAGAVLGAPVRGRAWAMLGALVLTPVLLLGRSGTRRSSNRFATAARGVGRGGVGLACVGRAGLAVRAPAGVLRVAALAALPFRVPVQSGGSASNLLVPLYVVIGAGALAWLVPRLAARRAGEAPAERAGALEWVLDRRDRPLRAAERVRRRLGQGPGAGRVLLRAVRAALRAPAQGCGGRRKSWRGAAARWFCSRWSSPALGFWGSRRAACC